MAAHVCYVKSELSRTIDDNGCIGLAVYVDDRLCYSIASDPDKAAQALEAIDAATRVFDAAAGFIRHPDKGEIFCSSNPVKEAVARTNLEKTIGPVVEATNILGINWTFRGRASCREA